MAENEIKIIFKGDDKLSDKIKKLDKATKSLINSQAKLEKQGKKSKTDAEKNAVAMNKLGVRITALGLDYKKVILENKNFGSALLGNQVALEKIKIATRDYINENKKATASTRILGGSFAVLRSKMLLFQFAMALGVRQLLSFSREASKVESMERAFNTLAGGGEDASNALSKLRIATNNTMSSFDLFQQANNAMILGVSKNSDEMAEMFDIAQRLGNALGRDTAQSVESLVTGIGRQSRLMLDNIGIIVRSEDAYSDYAKEIGKNSNELTDLEKKQAFTNATLKQARLLAKLLAPEIQSSQMAFDSLGASTADLSVEIGRALTPALKILADLTRSLADSLDAEDFKVAGQAILSVAIAFGTYKTAVMLANLETKKFTLTLAKNPALLVASALSTLVFTLFEYSRVTNKSTKETLEQSIKISGLTEKANKLRTELKTLINEEEAQNDIIERNNKLRDKQIEKTNSLTENLYNELVALKLQKAEMEGMSAVDIRRLKNSADLNKFQQGLLDNILKEILAIEKLKETNKKAIEDKKEQEKQDRAFAKFKQDRINAEEVMFGDLEAFKIIKLNETIEHFKQLGFTEIQLQEFKEKELKRIAEEGAKNRQKLLDDQSKQANLALGFANRLSGALAQATLNGQNMGEAVVNSIKAIAVEMASKALMFTAFQALGIGGVGTVGKTLGQFLGFAHTGGLIKDNGKVQRFATGGIVQGQDNVPIMAQAGEFIIRRAIVEQVGVDNLARLNSGEGNVGSTVNVNINGNMIGNEEFVRDTLIPEINKTVRQGLA